MLNQAAESATLSTSPDAEDEAPIEVFDSLSGSTLAALQEFLAEQKKAAENAEGDPFAEDWGLSQFWYTQETAHRVAEEVVEKSDGGRQPIACVACPSLFRELKVQHRPLNLVFEAVHTGLPYSKPTVLSRL